MIAVWLYLWAGLTTAWALWHFCVIAGEFYRLPGMSGLRAPRFDVWVFVVAGLLWWMVLPIWAAVVVGGGRDE